MDRFDDMRARGGSGGGGGGVNVDGTEVSIICDTNISAGNRFAGTASGDLPILSSQNIISSDINCVSDDLTVFMKGLSSLTKTVKSFLIYIKDEYGEYEQISIPAPSNLSDVITASGQTSLSSSAIINEDGTLIMISGTYNSVMYALVVIEINKETKSGISYAMIPPTVSVGKFKSIHAIRENFLFAFTSDNNSSASNSFNKIYRWGNGEFTEIFSLQGTSKIYWSNNGIKIIGNYFYACTSNNAGSSYIYKIAKDGTEVASTQLASRNISLSDDGLIGILNNDYRAVVYDMDLKNLNLTQIFYYNVHSGAYSVYPDSNGYVICSKGIFNLTTGDLIYSSPVSDYLRGKFDSKKGWLEYISPNTSCYKISEATNGEYIVKKYNSNEPFLEGGKVYGVALEDISAGEVGAGKIMFLGQSETMA